MEKWKTKNGYEIVQVLNGKSNSFLIYSEYGNILVDTGKAADYGRLQKNIGSLNLKKRKIDLLILTHTHYDHCENAHMIKKQENCKIITGEKEAQYSENGYTPLPKGTFAVTRFISDIGNRFGKKGFGYKPFVPDILVKDKLDLKIFNFEISLLLTDGHSDGSVSVIVDHEIAIVGDTMLGLFKTSVFPPFADNINKMINSWGQLLETNCDIFLPGHGKAIKRQLLQSEYDKYKLKYKNNR